MLTHTAANTVIPAYHRMSVYNSCSLHRTLLGALAAADALINIYTHAQHKRQPAA